VIDTLLVLIPKKSLLVEPKWGQEDSIGADIVLAIPALGDIVHHVVDMNETDINHVDTYLVGVDIVRKVVDFAFLIDSKE